MFDVCITGNLSLTNEYKNGGAALGDTHEKFTLTNDGFMYGFKEDYCYRYSNMLEDIRLTKSEQALKMDRRSHLFRQI